MGKDKEKVVAECARPHAIKGATYTSEARGRLRKRRPQ